MCGSMVDIQSQTADIRRGEKEEERKKKKKPQGKNIMSASAMQGGHNTLNCRRETARLSVTFKNTTVAGGNDVVFNRSERQTDTRLTVSFPGNLGKPALEMLNQY